MSEAGVAPAPAAKNVEAIYLLSPLQEGLLFHTVAAPGSGVYVVQVDLTLEGELDIPSLRRAWESVADRHAALRTLFLWKGRNQPLQVVRRQVALPWTQLDWRHSSPEQQECDLADFLAQDRTQGFMLDQAPLMRFALVRTGDCTWQFLWSFHHLILDGWSYAIVVKEVLGLYRAFCRGENLVLPPVRTYREHIAWLQKQDRSKAEQFWLAELRGFAAPTPFGVDRVAAAGGNGHHRRQRLELPDATAAALRSFARERRLTLNTLVQGAWAILLSRYSGEDDVVFGVTSSGRPDTLSGAESVVGLFINSIPLRARVDPEAELLIWLQELQAHQLETRRYENTPLTAIQKWSDVPAGSPLFESLLAFENYPRKPVQGLESDGLAVTGVRYFEQMSFPLALQVFPDSTFACEVEYDSGRFDEPTIGRMLGHLQTLLEAMPADPNRCLRDMPILTEPERRQLLVDWSDTAADVPCQEPLHHLFEQQVERTPNRLAVVFGDEQLTYHELNQRANQLAHYLRSRGVAQEVLVGVYMERSVEMIVSVLAILKSGGAYVPLDPNHPSARVETILDDAQVELVLTQAHLSGHLQLHSRVVSPLDVQHNAIRKESLLNPAPLNTPGNLAYVLYTSGSTGRPKGVAIEHGSATTFVRWAQTIFTPEDLKGVLFSTSLCFDLSVFEIFVTLSSGGTLVVAENALQFKTLSAAREVTLINTVPSAMAELVCAGNWPGQVRTVNLAGETLLNKLAQAIYAQTGVQNVYNLYGPTEATTYSTWMRVANGATKDPTIGRPIANTQTYILDRWRHPVPIGVAGELYLGGAGLARGYWRRPELTTDRFVPNPFTTGPGARLYRTGDRARYLSDGNIEYLGRIDHQVKLRGFRIELGEIETVLGQHPAVRECVVIVRDDESDTKRLVAYCVLAENTPLESLRSHLKERLPDYMVPFAFVELKAFPLTPNGKVDRSALPAPALSSSSGGQEFVAPRTAVEEILAAIWCDILHLEHVDVRANFFDLGGSSLDYFALLSRVEKEFGTALTMRAVRQFPTIEQLAKAIVQPHEPGTGTTPRIRFRPIAGLRRWLTESQPWKELRQHLYKSVIPYGPVYRGFVPSYALATSFLSWLSGCWFLRSYLRSRLLPLRQILSLPEYTGPKDEASVTRRSIFCNVWFLWRMAALFRSTPEEFDRWVRISGFPAFRDACRQGGGVVLVTSHNHMRRVVFWLLHRAGLDDLDSVGEPDRDRQLERMGLPALKPATEPGAQLGDAVYFPVRLYKAKQVLKRGGIVWMAPDGYHGSSAGVTVPLFGRNLTIRAGFAELALDIGAKIAAVTVVLDERGRLTVDFLPFLQPAGSTHRARVESLVRQYSEVIRKEWGDNLGNANWTYLRIFMGSPAVEPHPTETPTTALEAREAIEI